MSDKIYGRSCSQVAVIQQERYSIHKGICQIPVLLTADKEIDTELMKKAVDIEIERNDALRCKITFDKKHDIFEQTFVKPYKYEEYNGKITEYDFTGKTKEHQEKQLKKLAIKELEYTKLNIFRIAFLKTYDGKFGLFFSATHMVCDSWGVFVTLTDILDVYVALKNKTEMPKPLASYEECLAKELETQTEEKNREDVKFVLDFYEKYDAPEKYPGIIDKRLPYKKREGKNASNAILNSVKALLFDKSKTYNKKVPAKDFEKWKSFCSENSIPFPSFLMYGYSAYLSKINNTNDLIFWNICARRATMPEKRTAGTRANAIFPRFVFNDNDTVDKACSLITDVQNHFFRHADVSSLKCGVEGIETKYNLCYYNNYGCMVFSFIAMPYNPPKGWNCDLQIIPLGHTAIIEYAVMIVDMSGNLNFNMEYCVAYTNEIQVKATVDGVYNALNEAIKDKNKTFKQVKDSIK